MACAHNAGAAARLKDLKCVVTPPPPTADAATAAMGGVAEEKRLRCFAASMTSFRTLIQQRCVTPRDSAWSCLASDAHSLETPRDDTAGSAPSAPAPAVASPGAKADGMLTLWCVSS